MTIRQYLEKHYVQEVAEAWADYIEWKITSREAGKRMGRSHQQVINDTAKLMQKLEREQLLEVKDE